MGPKTEQLCEILRRLGELLESDGQSVWRDTILRARARLLDADYSGIELLLSAYGGMGSLNDLVLGQTADNGKFAWKSNSQKMNEDLDRLRAEAWDLARWVRDNHSVEPH